MDSVSTFKLDAALIGAQKAGTTTLFGRLARHPDVSSCRGKEPMHFLREDWREGMDDYRRLFSRSRGGFSIDGSTTYGFAKHADRVAARLHEHNPELRVIFLVREPVGRIVSAYRHAVERGWGRPSLVEEMARNPQLIDNSRYATCLAPYRRLFGPDRILILPFESITGQQDAAVADVTTFLGLAPTKSHPPLEANARSLPKRHHRHDDNRLARAFARHLPRAYGRLVKPALGPCDPTLSSTERAAIRALLRPEIETIESWSGLDLSAWYR